MEGGPIDLPSLDRDARRAVARETRLAAMLASEEGRQRARTFDPWQDLRHVTTQATFRALRDLEPAAHDRPLRDALARWVYECLQARIGKDLAIDDAGAVHRKDEALARRGASPGGGRGPDPSIPSTYAEAFARVLRAKGGAEGAEALARAAELAAPVAAVRSERRARRFEAARRLGLSHPMELGAPIDLDRIARALLDATEPLATELLRREASRTCGRWEAAHAMRLALAKDAREGWPARLGARWFDEVFRAIAPRGAPLERVPEALGGASFLRAAAAWGAGLRTAGAPRSMPFALARDPYPRAAERFGAAVAVAVADPVFQRRSLGLVARAASAQARSLRVALFFAARERAARAILSWRERADASELEELGSRVFGAPMPAALAGAWPEPRVDEGARLLAVLDALAFVRALVDRHDEDWFRNPKAGAHLAGLACAHAFDGDPPPEDAPEAIARAFEEALG